MMKKRAQCGLFCPMGAFQSFTNKLSIFGVHIDKSKCVDCGLCADVCPMFAMDRESIRNGQAKMTCSRCGKCIEQCPKGAIGYHIKGTDCAPGGKAARMMFVYPAFLLLGIMSSGMIQAALYRVLLLVITGSILR